MQRCAARWGARLCLLLLAPIVPLLVLEAAIRLFGPILPGNYNTGTFLTPHQVFGRYHVPGFDGWLKTPEFTTRVTINAAGLRGPERPYAKPPGTRRVLVLGDSFVEAAQVQEPESVVGRLQAALDGPGGRVEVLNGGVGGWGAHQAYVFLREEAVRYEPDLVIVQLYLGNDVYDTSWHLQGRPKQPREPYFVFEPDGSLRQLEFLPRRSGTDDPFADGLRRHTLLWNVYETGVLFKLYPQTEDADEVRRNRFNFFKMIVHSTKEDEDRRDEAWRVLLTLYRRMAELGAERGFKTALVVAPALYQVDDDDWAEMLRKNREKPERWSQDAPNRFLAAHAGEVGMPMLDLLPAFRAQAAEGGPPLYFAEDRHWTAAGHALATREIEAFLRREGLSP